jgi:hypothetical protein
VDDCALPWGGSIPHGESVIAYDRAVEDCGAECHPQERTCDDGLLSGSYSYESCEIEECPDVFRVCYIATDAPLEEAQLWLRHTLWLFDYWVEAPAVAGVSGGYEMCADIPRVAGSVQVNGIPRIPGIRSPPTADFIVYNNECGEHLGLEGSITVDGAPVEIEIVPAPEWEPFSCVGGGDGVFTLPD